MRVAPPPRAATAAETYHNNQFGPVQLSICLMARRTALQRLNVIGDCQSGRLVPKLWLRRARCNRRCVHYNSNFIYTDKVQRKQRQGWPSSYQQAVDLDVVDSGAFRNSQWGHA
ncbi:hypothetical protein EVAR_46818_1 [Eumeta japonica]|uniref:Uncharacterized protein n=1 Tax=Eumeta variegata TaxID=151549 RepID=A0A4C1ZSX0_EUMVA|nr:hypothetical protein EVAR_46818_1 [Eumeta japonica]